MPHNRNFKIRYFQAGFDGEAVNADRVHQHIVRIAQRQDRSYHVDSGPIMLVEYVQLPVRRFPIPVWKGEMHRLRVHDRVAQGNEDGDIADVILPDGRYISECSYFLFVPSWKVLAYFSTMHSVSWTLFSKYLNHFLPENQRVEVLPMLNRRLMEQFQQMDDVRKVTLKVARPNGWQNRPESLNSILDTIDQFGADQFTLELSNNGGRRPLALRLVSMVRGVARHAGDEERVKKLIVEGYARDAGDEKLVIDLLKEVLDDETTYDADEITCIGDYKRMAFSNLEGSLTEHLEYLGATVGANHDEN